MRSGTVDGLNANCANNRCVTVELLTGEIISIPIEGKTTCSAVWNRVEGELAARGVVHPGVFGLAIKSGSDYVFVDSDAKILKYLPKEAKFSSTSSSQTLHSVNDGKLPVVFYCRVHFYLDALPQNFDVVSLHHYYLQLRQNLVAAPRFPPASVTQSLAYAFQSEFGDWRPNQEHPRWLQSSQAQRLISSLGSSLIRAHQALAGLGQQNARLAFIRAVMPQYNMHLFGMTLKTKEGKDAPAWIGVTPKGIEVYQNAVGCNEIPEQPKLTFLWANITKLYFERKKFEIRGRAFPWANSTQKLSFTGSSESVPRHLLLLCRSTHQFHLSNHKILLNSNENYSNSNGTSSSCATSSSKTSGASTGGESSCNSTLGSHSARNEDTKMLDLSLWADGLLLTGDSDQQRVSVISNGSSNTTSGIVSDRVYSLDGSEAEDLEIPDVCGNGSCSGGGGASHNGNLHHHHHHHHHHHNNIGTSLETSLESLSQRHPIGPTSSKPGQSGHQPGSSSAEEEAKYWYCDSDCEDCDDSHEGPCRSSLVRTIGGEAKSSVGNMGCHPNSSHSCECNSCLAEANEEEEEEEDQLDCCGESEQIKHTNTPSMASETTLKAVDMDNCEVDKNAPKLGTEEIEEYKLEDDEDEHVYGEISEDIPTSIKTEEEREYSTIQEEEEVKSLVRNVPPKPKPRKYSCIKSVEPTKSGCKCKSRDKCCNPGKILTNGNNAMCKKIIDNKLILSSSSVATAGNRTKKCNGNAAASSSSSCSNSNGLTPKVASLKCLRKVHRTQKESPSSVIKIHTSSREQQNPPMNYVEFGEKLQQGKYPSTRTVSDNFDTDSDYVQLPPLSWYPPPPKPPPKNKPAKLWKFLDNNSNKSQSQCQLSPPNPPEVNINTLPRRKTSCDIDIGIGSKVGSNEIRNGVGRRIQKVSSRSTTALNLLGQENRPEPPPKPRKSLADLTNDEESTTQELDSNGNAIDARFIATKPQILIQTAYATTAPMAIPSQAQVLVRGTGNGLLQHSQSVDNIYDTVASEEIPTLGFQQSQFHPSNRMTPPPYSCKNVLVGVPGQLPPLIMRPGNYIDVHASGNKNKKQIPLPLPPTTSVASAAQQQTNAYIAAALGGTKAGIGVGNRCGSMPNNLNNFLIGLQNLKPLSRTPIVHPGPGATTSCLTLNNNNNNNQSGPHTGTTTTSAAIGPLTSTSNSTNAQGGQGGSRFTTVYTNQLTRSQIQQFKAQLYSDLDYVIFPQKDPRVSQQEYFDSKSLSYTTVSSTTNSNPMLTNGSVSAYQINDIPPPYLPPPPPYPSTAVGVSNSLNSSNVGIGNIPPPLPRKNPKKTSLVGIVPSRSCSQTNVTSSSLSNHSIAVAQHQQQQQQHHQPYHHNSFQSLYNPGSNCSSSQYGYYCASAASGPSGLNAENLQRFLSTQSFAASTSNCSNGAASSIGGGAIYYPSSTQSAPPLPPYNRMGGSHNSQQQQQQKQVMIENGMRKAIQQQLASIASRNGGRILSDERLRMKLCRSEESLYSQPTKETEEHLQAIYNLPPPPPYKGTVRSNSHLSRPQETMSAADLDLANLRAKCQYLELPLLRALCSEGELLSKNKSTRALLQAAKNKIRARPTAHAHPIPPPKLSLPPKKPPMNPPLPPKLSTPKNQTTTAT